MISGTLPDIQPSSFGPVYLVQKNSTHSQKIMPGSIEARIPFLTGFLNCPDVNDHIGADKTGEQILGFVTAVD
jgi:hypothetical protein